jgi:hypothetical protein
MTRPPNAYGGGWVGVSGQLTPSDSCKSWYPVYPKSSFSMRARAKWVDNGLKQLPDKKEGFYLRFLNSCKFHEF